MSTSIFPPQMQGGPIGPSIETQIGCRIEDLISSLPASGQLTSGQQREMIGRYTAVLEGNFIYWMTATLLAVKSEEARPILLENLHEEVRDSHPVMLRKFAVAAHAAPSEAHALAVQDELTNVRLFLGKLSGVQSLLTMAFFEGFIQRFMAYLAELAVAQGSSELEYTTVHGVCDIAHTDGLFRAFAAEQATYPLERGANLFEGVELLSALIERIISVQTAHLVA